MEVLITEIVLKIFSKHSQRDKRFVNNFSENEYIITPIVEKLKQSILITMKHSEGSYVAPLIYSATWHFAIKNLFCKGLFLHDSHVMKAMTSLNSWYRLKVKIILKVGEHGKD